MSKAPTIYQNEQRPPYFQQMIHDCAKNIHLREHAEQLLTFYANQADGFSPSLIYINKITGLAVNKIHELRQQLMNYGLINYSKEKSYIYIAWNRIRAYAMLESPLRITRNKCAFYPFIEEPRAVSKRKTLKQLGAKYKIKEPRQLSPWEEMFYNKLEQMTEPEYYRLVEYVRQNEFPHYPAFPPDISDKEWVSSIEEY